MNTPLDRDTLFRLFGAVSDGTISVAESAMLAKRTGIVRAVPRTLVSLSGHGTRPR